MTLYRSMIGKLQYVVHSRLDIAHAIGLVARFSFNPKESHLIIVKRIFKHLKGTEDYGFQYGHKGDVILNAFTDVDWEGNLDYKKSTSGGALFLNDRLVPWIKKMELCISINS